MRRADREVKDISRQLEILGMCETINVAFNDEKYPYIIPMNFGVHHADGKTAIYLHCAREGYKLKLMEKNPYVGFSACWSGIEQVPEMHCHAVYRSVVGGGRLSIVTDKDEQVIACNAILSQYDKWNIKRFSNALFSNIWFLRLEVEQMTGKQTGLTPKE